MLDLMSFFSGGYPQPIERGGQIELVRLPTATPDQIAEFLVSRMGPIDDGAARARVVEALTVVAEAALLGQEFPSLTDAQAHAVASSEEAASALNEARVLLALLRDSRDVEGAEQDTNRPAIIAAEMDALAAEPGVRQILEEYKPLFNRAFHEIRFASYDDKEWTESLNNDAFDYSMAWPGRVADGLEGLEQRVAAARAKSIRHEEAEDIDEVRQASLSVEATDAEMREQYEKALKEADRKEGFVRTLSALDRGTVRAILERGELVDKKGRPIPEGEELGEKVILRDPVTGVSFRVKIKSGLDVRDVPAGEEPEGRTGGDVNEGRHRVAASLLAEALGASRLVPTTVVRHVAGRWQTLEEVFEDAMLPNEFYDDSTMLPQTERDQGVGGFIEDPAFLPSRADQEMIRVLDFITGDSDRGGWNMKLRSDGGVVMVDQDGAFTDEVTLSFRKTGTLFWAHSGPLLHETVTAIEALRLEDIARLCAQAGIDYIGARLALLRAIELKKDPEFLSFEGASVAQANEVFERMEAKLRRAHQQDVGETAERLDEVLSAVGFTERLGIDPSSVDAAMLRTIPRPN
jgi:hypothetical protein